jgi:hypothetical protein
MLHKDDLNQILDRNIAWIENCDNKASIALGTIGVIVGLVFAFDYSSVFIQLIKGKIGTGNCGNYLFLFALAAALCAFIYGGYNLIKTLIPKTNAAKYQATDGFCLGSLIFFSSIASHEKYKDFAEKLKQLSEADYLNDISSQIYICAKICDEKFKSYKRGVCFSASGLVAICLLMFIAYIL